MTLIHLISAVTWGGGERYALDICRYYRSQGWHVVAITRDARAVDALFEREGIRLRHLPLRGYYDILSAIGLASMLRRRKDEIVIHVHKYKDAFTALLARKLSGRHDVKVVMTRHLVHPGKTDAISRRIYRNLDAHIFVSRLARDSFMSSWQEKNYPAPLQRVHTLHNSLLRDIPPYQAPPDKGPRIILFLGRLSPEKGIETIIEALPAIRGKRARLQICGTGGADYVDSLKRLADRLQVADLIDWRGYVADTDAAIRGAHIAVLPSRVPEAFGLANIEIMAMGRVQITTNNGAQREYLSDGRDALFIAPDDSQALASHLLTLLDNPDQILRMGQSARATYEATLAPPAFTRRLTTIYRS